MMSSPSTFARRSAAVGVLVWLLLLLPVTSNAPETDLIHKVLIFGVLVVVPLGLSLIAPRDQSVSLSLYRLAVFAQPVAALPAIASLFFEKGLPAAALAGAWLILTVVVALLGISRLISRGPYPLEELSIDAGCLYLPVAGVWFVVYRFGIQPLGYGETIILLTAVHFHFAGFAAPIIAGMSGRVLATREHPRSLFALAIFAMVAANPVIAAGITFSPMVGFMGTLLLSTGLLLLAVLTVGWVRPAIGPVVKQLLLLIGAASTGLAMVLACLYAYSLVSQTLILTIPTMAMTHGLLNGFGFVGCSLLAWSRIMPKELI
jgi:hypothetical protein